MNQHFQLIHQYHPPNLYCIIFLFHQFLFQYYLNPEFDFETKFLSVKEPKSVTPVVAIYKESGDFDKVLHILHQPTDSMFDPWYIGYGMDDENGHNRNLGTIYTI